MNNLFLIGALGVGAYLLFREQIDAALSGETPTASPPSSAPSGSVPQISPTTGKVEYPATPPVNLPSVPTVPTVPPPVWAQGVFYGRNPQTGGSIRMSIESSGRVVLVFDANPPSYASINDTLLTNGPYQSRVTQIENGIRTTSTTDGEYIDYFRTPIATTTTTTPVPVITIPPPVVPSPYPQMPNPVPQVPVPQVPTPRGGCLRYPCEPEIFI